MADVFVSYKKEDRAWAEEVVAAVEAAGYSVWWDDDLTPRSTWDSEIEREIAAAKAVLALWTARSVAEGTFVRIEALYAKEHRKLVPVRLERCQLPLAFGTVQTADLSSWNRKDASHSEWRRTLGWLAECIGRPAGLSEEKPQGSRRRVAIVLIGGAGLAVVAGLLAAPAFLRAETPIVNAVPAKGSTLPSSTAVDGRWTRLLSSTPISYDAAMNQTLTRVGERVVSGSGLSLDWEFVVGDIDSIDARYVPRGKIWITAGLMRAARQGYLGASEDDFIAVSVAELVGHLLTEGSDWNGTHTPESCSAARQRALDVLDRAGFDRDAAFSVWEVFAPDQSTQ